MKHLLEVRVQVACLVALFSLQLAAGLLDGAWIKGTTGANRDMVTTVNYHSSGSL